jgi:hypothetical protein
MFDQSGFINGYIIARHRDPVDQSPLAVGRTTVIACLGSTTENASKRNSACLFILGIDSRHSAKLPTYVLSRMPQKGSC